jgi:hypothetical protein
VPEKQKAKLSEWIIGAILMVPIAYVLYLFISVVFLGGGSACPQNLC